MKNFLLTNLFILFLLTKIATAQEIATFEHPDWLKDSFLEIDSDYEEALEENKGMMLYFYQEGCPYCKAFVEKILKSPDIGERIRKEYDVVDYDIRGSRDVTLADGTVMNEIDFAALANIQYTPTLVFLKAGNYPEPDSVLYQVNGYYPPKKFVELLDELAGQKAQAASSKNASLNKTLEELFPPFSDNQSPLKGELLAVLLDNNDCAECTETLVDVLSKEENLQYLNPYRTLSLNPSSKDYMAIAEKNNFPLAKEIIFSPTVALFKKTGNGYKEVFRMESQLRQFHFAAAMEYVSTGAFERQPAFQRYIDERTGRSTE